MSPSADHYQGSLLGLALGDALGAPHEGGLLERLLWRCLGSSPDGRRRFTDDTQMALDLAESLLACGEVDQNDLAARFAKGYRWTRGYGPGAARVLKRIRSGTSWQEANRSVYPGGSFGNGGAMRSPVVALFFHRHPARIAPAARETAEVTHAHPVGMEAAAFVAEATAAALDGAHGPGILLRASRAASGADFAGPFAAAQSWLESASRPSPREVRARLGMGTTAPRSCVTALYLAARFLSDPFEDMLRFAADAGGDVDTVGAIAGAIWGARNGVERLPRDAVQQVEDSERIRHVASRLHERSLEFRPG